MLTIKPFQALRYSNNTDDLSGVLAPPYDVISDELQDALYERNPHNVIRLILGKQYPSDSDSNNRYSRAKETLESWKKNGTLVKDTTPSFYLYEHDYKAKEGGRKRLIGLVGVIEAVPFSEGVVLPHENTLSGPIEDRLSLMKSCKSNLSQVFTLFCDEENQFRALIEAELEKQPLYDIPYQEDRYRVWRLSDINLIEQLELFFHDKTLLIADGHHRYTTALHYKDFCRQQGAEIKSQSDYMMVFLSNLFDEGLNLYPTHRVCFGLDHIDKDWLLSELKHYFSVETFTSKDSFTAHVNQAEEEGVKRLGLLIKDDQTYYSLTLTDFDKVAEFYPEEASETLRKLDVSILHKIIIEGILGVTQEQILKQENLKYLKESSALFEAVDRGDVNFGFYLNATKLTEMRDVSNLKEKMPQKSTYFYPKLISGLVMNEIDAKVPVHS